MEKLVLFHGSDKVIRKPIYGYGNKHNDYGLGFYCTVFEEAAREWSCKNRDFGIVNKYVLDASDLKVLDLTNKERYSVLNWIAILLHFRNLSSLFIEANKPLLHFLDKYYIDVSKYDAVIGFRADDSYFKFPVAFLENKITLEKLEEVYRLGDLGSQIALISKKSFNNLLFVSYKETDVSFRYQYTDRINEATNKFEQILSECNSESGTFLRDLVKENDTL